MSCTGCGLSLGKIEEEYGDMLGGMCLICFRELIGQTDVWYDKPPATKILKEGVRIRMYRDSKGKWHKLYGNFTNAHHCGEVSRWQYNMATKWIVKETLEMKPAE